MTTPAPSQPQQEAEVHGQFEPGSERPVSDTPRDSLAVSPDVLAAVQAEFENELAIQDKEPFALQIGCHVQSLLDAKERELADAKAHFEACERRRMLTAEERDQAQDDLRTARRALAAERRLAAQARELLSDSAKPFDAGCALLLQIPEGGV